MPAAADRLEFAPPQPPGLLRAFVLAVIAHLLLVLALTYGLRWQRDTQVVAAEAELWSQVPQQAAPKPDPVPPPPPPTPPAPQPVVKAPPQPDPQVQRDAQIALERERDREREKREAAERKKAELEKERDRKRKLDAQRKHEEDLARLKQEKLQKQEEARMQAEARRKDDEKKKRQQEQQDKKLAQLREENMKRMQGMAGTGAPGAAARSSGTSLGWAGRVQGRVRPNIVFTDDIPGNPEAIVAVRLAPDGTIVSKRIKKSSGNKAWDDAVLRALDKTEVLPRDVDGHVPPEGDLVFKPKG
jgi:colicin import membrane protein